MGNNISLEENENEDQGNLNTNTNDVEMKPVSSNEYGENSNNNIQQVTAVKRSKKIPNDVLKKRKSTSKNTSASVLKKTKSVRRR
jgi:hypothetical protein